MNICATCGHEKRVHDKAGCWKIWSISPAGMKGCPCEKFVKTTKEESESEADWREEGWDG